jgi:hypothetical protein
MFPLGYLCVFFVSFFFFVRVSFAPCVRLARTHVGGPCEAIPFEHFSLHVVGFSLGFQIYIALFDKKMAKDKKMGDDEKK